VSPGGSVAANSGTAYDALVAPPTLDLQEVAPRFGLSQAAVRRLLQSGRLQAAGRNGQAHFALAELERLLALYPTRPQGPQAPLQPLRIDQAMTAFKLSRRHLWTLIAELGLQTYKRPGSQYTWICGGQLAEALSRRQPKRRGAKKGSQPKLDWAKAQAIRARYAAGGVTQAQLAREFAVSQKQISNITSGRQWLAAQAS
jgi:transposase